MLTKPQLVDLLLKLPTVDFPHYVTQSGKELTIHEYLEVVVDYVARVWEEIPEPRPK